MPRDTEIILDRLARVIALAIRTNRAAVEHARREDRPPSATVVAALAALERDREVVQAVAHNLDYLPGALEVRIGDPVPEPWEITPLAHPHRLRVTPLLDDTAPELTHDAALAVVRLVAEYIPPIT